MPLLTLEGQSQRFGFTEKKQNYQKIKQCFFGKYNKKAIKKFCQLLCS